jgi:hypothetical protein
MLMRGNAELFSTYCRDNSFYDNWLFCQEFDLANVILQEGEAIDARAATWDEISSILQTIEISKQLRVLETKTVSRLWQSVQCL